MYVVLFIVTIVAVIMFHEFGHFVTAKLFGMKAERFFLGFGPTLWSTKRGETEYGVKAFPAGGFVKIAGMTPWEPADPADDGRWFWQQAAWKRAIVLVSGSFTHFLVAFLLIASALAFIGLPVATNEVSEVVADSPAAVAGLEEGDVVIAVDGVAVEDFDSVREEIAPRAGDSVVLTVQSPDGATRDVAITLDAPHPNGSDDGFLGVGPTAEDQPLGIGAGLGAAISGDFSIARLTGLTIAGLGDVFSLSGLTRFFGSINDDGPREADGPISLVGVGQAVNAVGNQGDLFAVMAIMAQLNIVLGVLNLLPLPPLDGGHLAVLAAEEVVNGVRRVRGKTGPRWRLNPAVLTPIALVVVAFFVVLSFTALYVDLTRPASELFQ